MKQVPGLLIATAYFFLLNHSNTVYAEIPDFYSEAAAVTKRAGLSQAPNEVIDPFTGTLNIVHNDLVIPGNGGLDIRVQRVYSSQNVYNKLGGQPALNVLQSRSPLGLGWLMHFGRIRLPKGSIPCSANPQADMTNNPTVEMQDGNQQILFCNDFPSTYGTSAEFVTKNNGVADYLNLFNRQEGYLYIDSNGVKYTMNHRVNGGIGLTLTDDVWYATRIEDRNGNFLTITYYPASNHETVMPWRIIASDGRRVDFAYVNSTDSNKARLASVKYSGKTWTYSYQQVNDYLYQSSVLEDYYLLLTHASNTCCCVVNFGAREVADYPFR